MSDQKKTYGETALLTPANLLTAFRLFITPVFIWLIISHKVSWYTTIVGFVAAMSDYFDGIVARRQGTTRSGAFLDPLADKVVVLGSLYTLVYVKFMWILPVLIITARELWMTWFRSKMSKQGVSIPAGSLPKIKTMVQDLAIAFCVIPGVHDVRWLTVGTLWLAVTLTIVTGYQYYVGGKKLVVQ
jgi:CDP-diacylglycerol--glycerol-3-phosphate 3-phosphatidyltransferase